MSERSGGILRDAGRGSFADKARWVGEERAQTRLDRNAIYGVAIGTAYSEFLDPSPFPDGEVAQDVYGMNREALALVLDEALQSGDPIRRLQALRAIIDLTQEVPHHRHPEERFR